MTAHPLFAADYSHVPAGLREVRTRIAAACARAGRAPDAVRLVAVSKMHPAEAVLAALGAVCAPRAAQTRDTVCSPQGPHIGRAACGVRRTPRAARLAPTRPAAA